MALALSHSLTGRWAASYPAALVGCMRQNVVPAQENVTPNAPQSPLSLPHRFPTDSYFASQVPLQVPLAPMASQFIGLTILLTLNDLAHTRVRGLVAEVHGQELTLNNVLFVNSGYLVPTYTVNGLHIEDIEIVPSEPIPPPHPPQKYASALHAPLHASPLVVHAPPVAPAPQLYQPGVQPHAHPHNHPYSYPAAIATSAPPQVVAASQFVDPAILSISQKPPAPTPAPPAAQHVPQQPQPAQPSFSTPPRISATIIQSVPATRSSNPALKRQGSSHGSILSLNTLGIPATQKVRPFSANAAIEPSKPTGLGAPSSASVAISVPFGELSIRGDIAAESSAFDETDDNLSSVAMPPTPEVCQKFQGKRSRRGKSHLKRQYEQQRQPPESVAHDSMHTNVVAPGMFSGSIAQAATVGANHLVQPGMSGRKSRRPKRNNRYDGNTTNAEEEGWATEDVNDYKERDFDFQGNLDRFDKKTVFSQLKAEDTIAEGDRLVSFNRLPQRNPTSKSSGVPKKNYHHSENVLENHTNGQPLTERDGWGSPEFVAEESESSEDSDHHVRGRGDGGAVDSGRSSRRAMSRQESRRRSTHQLSISNSTAMRSLENLQYAQSSSGGGAGPSSSVKHSKATLRLAPSHRPCPVVSPLQMLDVERIAEVELCLTDDMMTENAGRGIAQVAIQAFGKRISATNHNALPVVLVFSGNHKSGARAIAAGRHLKNHHVRVMVCVLGLEREDELLEHVRRQLNIFRNAGGRVARWEELASNLKTLDSPPELIIDGLLGTHLSIEDLRTDQQATAFELVQFANKSKASVLAVDIPSGVDGSTGEVAQLEDTGAFHMKAKWVVCMGAPKSGLLNALVSGVGSGWNLYVADIGISNTAWRKYGTRRRHGVEFAADWVVTLEYHGGS